MFTVGCIRSTRGHIVAVGESLVGLCYHAPMIARPNNSPSVLGVCFGILPIAQLAAIASSAYRACETIPLANLCFSEAILAAGTPWVWFIAPMLRASEDYVPSWTFHLLLLLSVTINIVVLYLIGSWLQRRLS